MVEFVWSVLSRLGEKGEAKPSVVLLSRKGKPRL
jgi:hypothetical protein